MCNANMMLFFPFRSSWSLVDSVVVSTRYAYRRRLPVMHLRGRIGGVQAVLEGEDVI